MTRPLIISIAVSAALAISGGILELARFGVDQNATATRLEADVRARFADRSRLVEALARSVAAEEDLILAAETSPQQSPFLFDRLAALVTPDVDDRTSVTIYVSRPLPERFRILAWSEGPAEDLALDRLEGPAAAFVAPGAAGLRLLATVPFESEDGLRRAVVAAETALSPLSLPGSAASTLESAYGPVTVFAPTDPDAAAAPSGFVIADPDTGTPMLSVRYEAESLAAQRDVLRKRVLAAAAVPLVVGGLLLAMPLYLRRRRTVSVAAWFGYSVAMAGVLALAVLATVGLLVLVGARDPASQVVVGLGALGLAALIPGDVWWKAAPRRHTGLSLMFAAEHGAAGGWLLGTVWLLSRLLRGRINASSLDAWQFPLFPFDPVALLYLVGLFLLQIALCWTVASVLGGLAIRWHLGRRQMVLSAAAAALWIAPTAAVVLSPVGTETIAGWTWTGAVLAFVAFGLTAAWLRRHYRHTTQAMRLFLTFAAITAPVLVTYPMTASAADRAVQALIEDQFAPETAEHPQRLEVQLDAAQQEIDGIENLADIISSTPPSADSVPSETAFTIWRQTSLAASRLTAEIEVFGPDLRLVSRFALNVPEYSYGEDTPTWSGSGCEWEVFGEVKRLGATERDMLHSERGVCDTNGVVRGALVVHLLPDYESLPFVPSSTNTYAEALRRGEATRQGTRLTGLEVTVYGWGFTPIFTSGGVAWPITPDLADFFYASREPLWTTRPVGPQEYRVYFTTNRNGIYALGYPAPTPLEHVTRLAEAVALMAVLLLTLLIGASAIGPLISRYETPIPVLLHEVRTSFYRKLFLFFVVAAVGPVVVLAFVFGAYTAARVRSDVEREAASLVTVTRRLFEESTAVQQHPDQPQAVPNDDLMVGLRQVIHQDVNFFIGPRLVATSQRDLFDSGLVPGRTPAAVYRTVALDRLPTYVGEERLGSFRYLVAAAPVFPALGQDMLLSVPLATRQQEIEHEINELNRRVLVAAVIVIFMAAGLGASVASRVSDPVARLSRAARQISAGHLDVEIVADTADELRRLVDDFNAMARTLVEQRVELERTNQLKAWAQMARQVAHEIKNPLTPIQLAAEHLERVHEDEQRPLGLVFDNCLSTILGQVRLLRQISSEFANFATEPTPRPAMTDLRALIESVLASYRVSLSERVDFETTIAPDTPPVWADPTLVSRALTNLVENAVQAMPDGGHLRISGGLVGTFVSVEVRDDGVGMDADEVRHAFEPSFSTKTAGSGLGLPNARRNIERSGGTMHLESELGQGTTIVLTLPVAASGAAGNG